MGAVALLIATVGVRGLAGKIQLNPIKPTLISQPLTDEQQGIVAVRAAKASVVNIIGIGNVSGSGTDSAALSTISGTGFIIDSNGLIVSNSHVVEDSTFQYTVLLADGTQYDAKVLGLDKFDDVALLKISASGLPVANLGDSDSLETGQTVFAIGNSLGKYEFTVTKGVVSALGRQVNVDTPDATSAPRLKNLIQTDAAISPGNSGGPLINLAGQVIGMNTLMDTSGEGLGFAVPVNVIKDAVQQLQTYGKVFRPFLGVEFITIDKSEQVLRQLSTSQGAWVKSVTPGSPAAAAGLMAGDIIVQINHEPLTQSNELDRVVSKYPTGSQILITYIRNTQQFDTVLVLGSFVQN